MDELWEPMETAPKSGVYIVARDAEGIERTTWLDLGDWVYTAWRENEDKNEYETLEAWEPTEWKAS